MIVLGSVQAAVELLENRSQIYSSRPISVIAQLVSWDWLLSLLPYNAVWRSQRRFFVEHFSKTMIQEYHPIMLQECHRLLVGCLADPSRGRQHLRNLPSAVIARIAYGVQGATSIKEKVALAEGGMASIRQMLVPGAFLAELIPALRYIPAWLPGGSARKFAQTHKKAVIRMRDQPFYEVVDAINAGSSVPSIASSLVMHMQEENDGRELTADQEATARDVVGAAYIGAVDTTSGLMEFLILAIAMHPGVQSKAQTELDRVVGHSRLPGFRDLEDLTYLKAIVMETVRWLPVAPLGAPRLLERDDVYKGYHIPKGTVVSYNAWAMLRDPQDYEDPEKFVPERFIGVNGMIDPLIRDPISIAFGFGRRACPGVSFALSLTTIFAALTLHAFDIEAGVDEVGDPVVLKAEQTGEGISCPTTFPRSIKPRSARTEGLVHDLIPGCDEGI
ncbi:hypothetical protein EIP91_007794 [Steccherinum ochraceum]|uniref:Cytochrome P450-dit2 n=1 Tax=Steccherinum ochraceum TaxID=92696 RepID=A0A4R0R3S7_9APHY|nr:hypothetical protein EIP91_007794 [Steccherinum ochraceum]